MALFSSPRSFTSFKEQRLYSVEWAQQTLISEELEFHVISKREDTTYWDHGIFTSLSEAFAARRSLASQDPNHSFFLRASKLTYAITPSSPEASEDCDLWRDAFKTGRDDLVPADQLTAYRSWAAKKVSARQAYARFDRDQPRWF